MTRIRIRPSRAKPKKLEQSADYAPGHFTALMREPSAMHPDGWPPGGASGVLRTEALGGGLTASEAASAAIEKGRNAGRWYASGTVSLPNTPKNSRVPGRM